MFLKYNGKTKDFKYKGADFSKGPVEVSDETGKAWIANNPATFTQVIPVVPVVPAKPVVKAKPVPKKKK